MTRPFGVAAVQMAVEPWDAAATIAKMERIVARIIQGSPWTRMLVFHELAPSGVVQFDRAPTREQLERVRGPVPGPLTDRLCAMATRLNRWVVPGSLNETDGDAAYDTALAISPDGEIRVRYRTMFP